MTQSTGYLKFIADNAPFLAAGALLSFLSVFGQTFFISVFGGEIREEFNLTNGEWGGLYMIATMGSALVMVWAGGLADVIKVRWLGIGVIACLGLACIAMGMNQNVTLLIAVLFVLRLMGQGMSVHISAVAMARWFVATRGRALAVAGLGFMLGEAFLPLAMVWLKSQFEWRTLWIFFGVFCFAMCPVLAMLLRLERNPKSASLESDTLGLQDRHWTRAEVLSNPIFWLLVPAIMFFSAFGTVFWFQQVIFAEVKGWSHLSLVSVFPLGTAALALSAIVYGWAIDRFGVRRLLPFYLLPYVAAFVLHWYAPSLGWTALAVVLMGIAGGGQGTLLNACWAEFYGTKHIGSIKSAATALMVLGSALGPGISGWMLDIGIGIEIQMLGFAAMFVGAAVSIAIALRYIAAFDERH